MPLGLTPLDIRIGLPDRMGRGVLVTAALAPPCEGFSRPWTAEAAHEAA
jgi:hypothetical protein